MLGRREFILIGGMAAFAPPAARAQQQRAPVIGFLGFGDAAAWTNRIAALRAGLSEFGYAEGRNIRIEFRWGATAAHLRERAADLVRLNVDVIFATSSTETSAALSATRTLPIVFATHADPVGVGHVASLPRPGGNATGLCVLQSDLAVKALELLKEVVPDAASFGVIWSPLAPSYRPTLAAAERGAKILGISLHKAAVETAEDFEPAIASIAKAGASGLFVSASTITRVQRKLLAELAVKYRLPSVFGTPENAEAGGLMSYSPDNVDLTRRSAAYIDKILKGAKPSDLPVEQATRYLTLVNLKTAKALNVRIPEAILIRADRVIE